MVAKGWTQFMALSSVRKTVLVTGAAGFLGSHLVERLLAEGFEVVGLDNLMTGAIANLARAERDPNFHFHIGDVREPQRVYAELVFNLACPASPVHYQHDPHTTFMTSVLGTQRLLEMARGRRCTIVHTSTSEVYGDPVVTPQAEEYWGNVNSIGPRACYDEGKRGAETLLSDARRCWGIDTRIVRVFNTYGPRMALRDGRVVSNFITQALGGEPITIFGTGSQTRSFCFVDDLIEGLVRVAQLPSLEGPLNMGNPVESTMIELAKRVVELTGSESRIEHHPLPEDDPKQRRPDIRRARALIQFEPKVPLREGLERTIKDFRARLHANAQSRRRHGPERASESRRGIDAVLTRDDQGMEGNKAWELTSLTNG
jgi:UDP-glucuronate decarboxylase